MTEATDWGPALAILAGGLVLGALFIVYFRGKKSQPLAVMNELEAERDSLLEQLRVLDENATEERTRLELETADVLRRIDQRERKEAAPAAGVAVAQPRGIGNPALRGFLWGVGSFAALAFLAYFVMQSAKPRAEGESPVGGGPPGAPVSPGREPGSPGREPGSPGRQPGVAQSDPELQALESRVKAAPDDLNARVDLAKAYLERDNMMAVFEHTQYVLAKNPGEPRALTYQALVRLAMGEVENATKMLETATKNDPGLLDGWVALAWVHAQSGNIAAAENDIASAKKQHPEDAPRLDQVFAQVKLQIAQKGAAPAQQLPPDHPPIAPPPSQASAVPVPPPAPSGSASGDVVRVSLELAPSAQGKTGIIYVIVRATGVMGGPPVAVKRVAVAQLPTTIDLSQADSMMGQPLPPKMRIEARLDTDGDAATKNPSDPFAAQDAVAPGTAIKLALK